MMANVGTLKELGVGVGDVVVLVDADFPRFIGDVGTVSDDMNNIVCNDGSGTHKGYEDEKRGRKWRLISRATPQPKLWRDMSAEEKGALLLAAHEGKEVQCHYGVKGWCRRSLEVFAVGNAYRIKPEPKVETVTITGGDGSGFGFYQNGGVNNTHRITFNLIDGKPDCASIKMDEL